MIATAAPITNPAGIEPIAFELPDELIATEPVEHRGGRRDGVRLMVARRGAGRIDHARFADLHRFLEPGDVVVVNTSTTLPAALPTGDGLLVHLSTRLAGDRWLVELRRPCRAGSLRHIGGRPGQVLTLPGGGRARLVSAFGHDGPAPPEGRRARLWEAELSLPVDVAGYLAGHGRPIRYGCPEQAIALSAYQTIFATEPGSAEMPSAARPFTAGLVAALNQGGVGLATIVLHAGVSSAEAGEDPYPEWYRVPAATAAMVNAARATGRRIIAVGTTVVRALETAVGDDGMVRPGEGWTGLVVTPERGVQVVDGLITGWHEPRGSHLLLVEAVAGRPLLKRSYAAALAEGYLWHEFGDAQLILP